MESDTGSWREKGFGIELDDHKKCCTSNVRFADDALLMTKSLRQFKKRMTYTKRRTEEKEKMAIEQTIEIGHYLQNIGKS